MQNAITAIHIVLNLPRPVAALIVRASNIHDNMALNAKTFPSPAPTLTVFASDLTNLTTLEAAVKNRTKGAAATRNAALKVVMVDIHQLASYVEGLANADPDNAASIAQQAGMAVRKAAVRTKPTLATKQTSSGAVHVVAKATKGAKANNWQYSTDGGKTWLLAPTSTKSTTVITGLTPGATLTVRHQAVTKAGALDWSQPVTAIVT
jgi:hypothetical protein